MEKDCKKIFVQEAKKLLEHSKIDLLLKSRGWKYNPRTGAYYPPIP
jgi:hypothetical protein